MIADKYPLRLRGGDLGDMFAALDPAIDGIRLSYEDFANQLFVETATWGLVAWENALGIKTDLSRPVAFRRERVMSKLRGQGTTTVAMLIQLAESFAMCEVEIHERPRDHAFDVEFVGKIGLPPNMEGLTEAIREVKPAHLSFDYIIRYRTHGELRRYTHAELTGATHFGLREEDRIA